MRILLIGPPASGKGTIGKLLSKKVHLPLVNVGVLLRSIPPESIWYQPVNDAMDKGDLVPNTIVGGYLKEYLTDSHYEKGYILDGWLRQIEDLNKFDPKPDIVLHLNISESTSKDRILNRRVCEQHGHTYNLKYFPPKIKDICDIDGSKLIKREDDTLKVLQQRWKIYNDLTKVVLEHYRKQGILLEIDANNKVSSVLEEIMQKNIFFTAKSEI